MLAQTGLHGAERKTVCVGSELWITKKRNCWACVFRYPSHHIFLCFSFSRLRLEVAIKKKKKKRLRLEASSLARSSKVPAFQSSLLHHHLLHPSGIYCLLYLLHSLKPLCNSFSLFPCDHTHHSLTFQVLNFGLYC